MVKAYTNFLYFSLNTNLSRKGKNVDATCMLINKTLKDFLIASPKKMNMAVYSGQNIPSRLKTMQDGECFRIPHFLSTSNSEKIAMYFAEKLGSNSLFMTIASQTGVSISDISQLPQEQEVLFKSNTVFKIKSEMSKFLLEKSDLKRINLEEVSGVQSCKNSATIPTITFHDLYEEKIRSKSK